MLRFQWVIFSAVLFITVSCSHRPTVVNTEVSHLFLANSSPDSASNELLKPYKEKHDKEMQEVLVESEEALKKEQPEGALGDFVADAMLNYIKSYYKDSAVKTDMVLLNNGGLRVELPQGEITKGKIFELMPFDNQVVLVDLDGSSFFSLVKFIAEKGGMPVSGLRMEIDSKKKPVKVMVNTVPLDTLQHYVVITSDYLAEGGDNLAFMKKAPKKYTGILLRNVLLENCRQLKKEGKTISVKTDGRISFSK